MRRRDRRTDQTVDEAAGQAGALGAAPQAEATDAILEGMRGFAEMWQRVQAKLPATRRGHLFEAIVAARENAAAAAAGSAERLHVTHLEGDHTAEADLVRRVGGEQVGAAQAKFSALGPKRLAEMVSDPKYHGMDRYVPADRADAVREELRRLAESATDPQRAAEYRDALAHIKDHDTTLIDVHRADRHPTAFRMATELRAVAQEAGTAAAYGAAGGAIVGGAVSGVRNWIAYARGEIDGRQWAATTAKDSARAAVKGAGAGAGGAVIRYGAAKAGLTGLAKSNVATAMAAGVIDIGVTTMAYVRGEISGEVARDRMVTTGVATMGGMYSGYLARLLVASNPAAAAASVAGYWLASSIYQACRAIQQEAELAKAEADRVEALCAAAERALKEQQAEFERLFDERMAERRRAFARCFAAIDRGMRGNRFDETTDALADLALLFGRELEYGAFGDFDRTMRRPGPIEI